MRPLLSIVIANYNYGRFLEESIQSVLSQSCKDFEIIIVDGGSTDNSVEVIRKYAGGLPAGESKFEVEGEQRASSSLISYWVSEKDRGQSDAFNKGFAKASGRFLTWLNADDVMLPGTIAKLKCAAAKYPDCEWFVGGVLWVTPEMRVFNCGRGRRMSWVRARHGQVNVCGPSSFFTKDLYLRAGKIDERFQYSMDTDLWLRFALQENVAFRSCADYAWALRLHPAAKMSGHKFTSDGRILTGEESSIAFRKDHKRLEQLEREALWSAQKLPANIPKLTRWRSLLSARLWPAIMSRVDLMHMRGRSYKEFFK